MRTLAIIYLTIYLYNVLLLTALNIRYAARERWQRVYTLREVFLGPITVIRGILV